MAFRIEFTPEAAEHVGRLRAHDRRRLLDAVQPDYARAARRGPVILTRRGHAVAAVVALDDREWEDLKVSTSPQFAAIIARSEARYRREGGVSLEDLRRRTATPPNRRSRPAK